ncbi:MAG: divergent polysaccharide deacetylase family protein [Alphaproteobacteria bacterium]|nr:divergent polysaccharide deacetylase family protein [Alphaproteobacteria bacterium]
MKRYANPRGTLLFILLAVCLMIVVDFIFGGLLRPSPPPSYPAQIERAPDISEAPQAKTPPAPQPVEESLFLPPDPARAGGPFSIPTTPGILGSQPAAEPETAEQTTLKLASLPESPAEQAIKLPKAKPYKAPVIVKGHPKIAIIIDDMGVDRRRSREIIGIDAKLTLAFLPYAQNLDDLVKEARNTGHELMIHMPMEAMNGDLNLGGIALREGMDEATMDAQLEQAFAAFTGYKGMNNHMGSRLTRDTKAMAQVMQALKQRGLYFVDSKTINDSVAADVARAHGLRTGERDVFLDHQETDEFVRSALHNLEAVARRKGYAIAIGHPKDVTIRGLKAWAQDAQERGYVLVHASEILQTPAAPPKIAGDFERVEEREGGAEEGAEQNPKPLTIMPDAAPLNIQGPALPPE